MGMVGAGQLARMVHEAAGPLGLSLHVLADDANDGAALITRSVTVGDYRSIDDVARFATACDVITWDHEHVPNDVIAQLNRRGVNVQPGAAALRFAQDKAAMRHRLTELKVPCPKWLDLEASDDPKGDLSAFVSEVGSPYVLKAARGGYDGKGVWVLESVDGAAELLASSTPLIAEEKVAIQRELAAVVARTPSGEVAAWPVVETVQEDGICVEVLAPASNLSDLAAHGAQAVALRIADELNVTGVLAVELFETTSGHLLVNELAMRPHNSAHWTIEGSLTSQFEQHVRAILDWPLGATTLKAPHTVMVNVLGGPDSPTREPIDRRVALMMQHCPDIKLHLYGKTWRPGRKVGHVTATGDNLTQTRDRARLAAQLLVHGSTEVTR